MQADNYDGVVTVDFLLLGDFGISQSTSLCLEISHVTEMTDGGQALAASLSNWVKSRRFTELFQPADSMRDRRI